MTSGWWAHLTGGMPGTWTPGDVLYAIDHRPDGRLHPAGGIRYPRAVLGHRLSFWKNPDGTWMPSPSQARAAGAERIRREQAERRAEAERAAAAATRHFGADGRPAAAAAARAMLAAASPAAAVQLARAAIARQRPAQPRSVARASAGDPAGAEGVLAAAPFRAHAPARPGPA